MEMFTLPDGTLTADAANAAETWAKAFYIAKDALERIRPVPERILRKEPVRNLDEILMECDIALNLGDKLGM